ncbi:MULTISPECIES: hypothetical protein [Bacillus]|nr:MULTISPECIES: hypothetical protein [Bacillus cereus group]MED2997020.1 hypothetical protein [Bacillus tropicus]
MKLRKNKSIFIPGILASFMIAAPCFAAILSQGEKNLILRQKW